MGFNRQFAGKNVSLMKSDPLFPLLEYDIRKGLVFPAVRDGTLYFYHGGGVLFQFKGTMFRRNPHYDDKGTRKKSGFVSERNYGGVKFIDSYEEFKCRNRKHFEKNDGSGSNERQYLDKFYGDTYRGKTFPEICVLDIEVNFNSDSQKKCDMVLFNSVEQELMFVEGKLFRDGRMSCGIKDRTPEVINQVNEYSGIISKNVDTIKDQYMNHLSIMSQLFFDFTWNGNLRIIPGAKLLVYETPTDEEIKTKSAYRARRNLKKKVENAEIAALWVPASKSGDYSLKKIWNHFR